MKDFVIKFYPAALFFLFSCTYHNPKMVIVKGKISDIKAKKLYLRDVNNLQVFLDSATYKNDTFSFCLDTTNFKPFIASICFIDSVGKRHPLIYQNFMLSHDSLNYGEDGFILDRGITTISGKFVDHPNIKTTKLSIKGGKQNNPFFATQLSDFGWINEKDSSKREKIITGYKNLIKKYPYSYYFIDMLYEYRTRYSKGELLSMIKLFQEDNVIAYYKQKFAEYFKSLLMPGQPLTNYAFKNPTNHLMNIIDKNAKLNVLIFWASWCAPCRLELPQLRLLYNKFKKSNMHMVSISIDKDKKAWTSLIKKEALPWDQLVIEDTLLETIKNKFNFSTIPLVVFTDNSGIEIGRFKDYSADNEIKYENFIENHLK